MNIQEIIDALNFSSITWQIVTPIIFSIADVVTGFIQAVINKNLSSKKMREGILHKVLIIITILLSFVASFSFSLPFISKIVCSYIIIMEIISIGENLLKAGLDFGKLAEILKIKGKEEE